MPTVSVIIPSYNHEKYIRECIQSVLDQTYQDFEIIITDDSSTDHTLDVIESFSDPRIKLFKHSKNKGVSVAANHCLQHASGNYVAWISSDDAWYPEKLAIQVKYLDEHPEIATVFGKVEWVDESGNKIDQFPYIDVFNVANRSRYEWLRQFFVAGNCLSLPCSLVRKECFSDIGMLDPAFAGILDLDLWVRVCLKYDIMILDQKLLRNRWINDELNASGNTLKNAIRNRFEYLHILNHYLKIEKPEELLLIFPEAVHYGKVMVETIPYFLGRIAIASNLDFKMLWGLDVIYQLIQDEKIARLLEDQHGFSYIDFIKVIRECDSFRLGERQSLIEHTQTLAEQIAKKDHAMQLLTEQVNGKNGIIADMHRTIDDKQHIIDDKQHIIDDKQHIIEVIQSGLAYRMIQKYRHFIDLIMPNGTKRRRLYARIMRAISKR